MTQAIDLANNPYEHKKNIHIGHGRIVWGQPWGAMPSGWVLPGGERTNDYDRATFAASAIDRMSRAKK